MRFLGFFFGICEANAFSAYRTFSKDGKKISHQSFKDVFAWQFLDYCKNSGGDVGGLSEERRVLRSAAAHEYVSTYDPITRKRKRRICTGCKEDENERSFKKIGKACSCDTDTILCHKCYMEHYTQVRGAQLTLNNSL